MSKQYINLSLPGLIFFFTEDKPFPSKVRKKQSHLQAFKNYSDFKTLKTCLTGVFIFFYAHKKTKLFDFFGFSGIDMFCHVLNRCFYLDQWSHYRTGHSYVREFLLILCMILNTNELFWGKCLSVCDTFCGQKIMDNMKIYFELHLNINKF